MPNMLGASYKLQLQFQTKYNAYIEINHKCFVYAIHHLKKMQQTYASFIIQIAFT